MKYHNNLKKWDMNHIKYVEKTYMELLTNILDDS